MDTSIKFKKVNGKRKHVYNPKGKKKKKIDQTMLTSEELENLEMTHSNFLKMQIDDLLKEMKQIRRDEIDLWLDQFKEHVMNIPEGAQSSIKDFSLGENIKVPIIQVPESVKGCFKFSPPSYITDIGSYNLDTICTSTPKIDVAVEIPKVCWQSMDFLNFRYHRKRAIYLASIAYSLMNSDLIKHIEFNYLNDCGSKPILIVTPKGIENVLLYLTAYPNEMAFKESRFYPDKNNVRASWLYNDHCALNEPTPFYNSTVMADLLLIKLNEYLKENLTSENLKEAIVLLKIWLFQRDLITGHGRLNGFIITCLVVRLLKKRRISIHMSNYEIFKCVLFDLSNDSLTPDILDEFENFDVLFSVNKETLLMVKHEAKLALIMLDNMSSHTFTYLFMKKIYFTEKFEYILHLRNIKLDLLTTVCETLRKGLRNRILLLDVKKKPFDSWSLSLPPPNPDKNLITIGLLINPDTPITNLEKGPLANDPEAKEFRKFWGEQSELRRFQDGSIREAVSWPATTVANKRAVFNTIVKDILNRHFNIARDEVIVNSTETECVLQVPGLVLSEDFPPYGTGEEAHTNLMQSYNDLCKQLRSLKLPLLIASIQGTSSAFRFSEVFPPLSSLHELDTTQCFVARHVMKLKNNGVGVPPYVPALKIVVQFEGSGKWPDDVEALRRIKAAFHIKIAQLVKSECSLMSIPFVTHTDIFKDGYVFRLQVACHKEIFLLKQIKAADGSIKTKETKESIDLEISTQILPKLNGVLHGLHQQFNTYGTACRLAKRWLASQLKYKFIEDITVELIVAHIYLHPEPYICPCSPQVAYIRFLSLLITHNWMVSPLIINFNNEFKVEDIEQINLTFTAQRSTLPPMTIVTPFDKRGNMWTKNMPPALMLKRIILLAEASLNTINDSFLHCKFIDIKGIFRPPLKSFDVIIYLKRMEISRLACAVDVRIDDPLPLYKPYKYQMNELYPIVEYDPVQKYLEELIVNFGNYAVFLNDPYGGDFIAMKWKIAAFKPEAAKVSHGCKIIPKAEEILQSIEILGSGLIKNIEHKTENWQIP